MSKEKAEQAWAVKTGMKVENSSQRRGMSPVCIIYNLIRKETYFIKFNSGLIFLSQGRMCVFPFFFFFGKTEDILTYITITKNFEKFKKRTFLKIIEIHFLKGR